MAIVNVARCPYPKPLSVKLTLTGSEKVVNGSFIEIGKSIDDSNVELYEGKKLTDGAKLIGIIVEPLHPYSNEVENDMTFGNGDVVRVYPQVLFDSFDVSKKDCIDGAVAKGDLLKVKADSTKLTKDGTGASPIARVNRIYTLNGQETVRVEFI